MENKYILMEVLKGISVIFFLAAFYTFYKKCSIIVLNLRFFLNKNKYHLEKEYEKRLTIRVIKKEFSLKPLNSEKMNANLEMIALTGEFKNNLLPINV